jgi:hypothetical protein
MKSSLFYQNPQFLSKIHIPLKNSSTTEANFKN